MSFVGLTGSPRFRAHWASSRGASSGRSIARECYRIVPGVRWTDMARGYGGEEFSLIMPELSIDLAVERAEKLRREIEELVVEVGGRTRRRVRVEIAS